MTEPDNGNISVVVPVYNGGQTVSATIEHLLWQSLAPMEIIVVNDGSTDDTAAILKRFGNRIKVLTKDNGGPASARNEGARAASGSLIAFTDCDCFPDVDWLKELVKGFGSPGIVGTGGIVCGASNGVIGEYIDLYSGLNPGCGSDGKVLHLVTANAAFRRDELLKANLFDERFRRAGGEDTELSVRLRSFGYELAFVDKAVVRHRHKKTIPGYLKAIANHGEGQYIIEQLWPNEADKTDRVKQVARCAAGLGTMTKFYRSYRTMHDRKRALLFSFLDHCQYLARFWGYHRGRRSSAMSAGSSNCEAVKSESMTCGEQ
ncbi:MAG: glycosyltransferase [Acidobacteriota bacterium]